MDNIQNYLYEIKDCFLTKNEMNYISALIKCLPQGYYIQPQVGLSTIIKRTDNAKYQNELNRYVDACIFDTNYHPIAVIEINDSSHFQKERIERDEKVRKICEEAGLPLITFWTKRGINPEDMTNMLKQAIEHSKNPVRIKHSAPKEEQIPTVQPIVQTPKPIPTIAQKIEPEYSKKNKKIAVVWSVIFGFIGIPYYYAGRPILGIIVSIPFILYFLLTEFNNNIISETYLSFFEYCFAVFALCINIVSVILFACGAIKDKNGKYIK